jgi:hypothetical protein
MLLCHDEIWMIRRKLVVAVLDERWHRKQLSVDVQLPPAVVAWAATQKSATVPVPITMLFKAPQATMGFDFRDYRGHALSLPLLEDNLALSRDVLQQMALVICERASETEPGTALARLVSAAAEINPKGALQRTRQALGPSKSYELAQCLASSRRFRWLSLRLAEESLIVVDLPATKSSHLLKLSFLARNDSDGDITEAEPSESDTQVNGARRHRHQRAPHASWDPFRLSILADAWPSGSFHLEAQAPDELEIVAARISQAWALPSLEHKMPASEGARLAPARVAGSRNRIERTHLYLGDDPGGADWIRARIDFRVQRSGFLSIAAWSSILLAMVLILTAAAVNVMAEHIEASTVLLAGAATVAATAMMQTTRNSLAGHLLTVVRSAVLLSAFVAFCDLIWLFSLHLFDGLPFPWHGIVIRSLPTIAAAVGITCALICVMALRLPTVGDNPHDSRWASLRTFGPIAWLARSLQRDVGRHYETK